MLGLMLEHDPHGLLADLYWVLASSCHRPILSEVGASNFPGRFSPSTFTGTVTAFGAGAPKTACAHVGSPSAIIVATPRAREGMEPTHAGCLLHETASG